MAETHPDFGVGTTKFCIYCQREFASRKNFERHILTQHPNTYAYHALKRGDI